MVSVALASAAALMVHTATATEQPARPDPVRTALTFHASFDGAVTARHAAP